MELSENFAKMAGFFEFQKTDILHVLLQLKHRIIIICSGNQAGKTSSVAQNYFLRVLGKHPVEDKNRLAKKIRCMSSSLPNSSDPTEQDNTQYLELKKRIPYEMIEKDITARSANLVIRRPPGLSSDKTVFEFRSSKQELQDLGKIQLSSVWHDEETPKPHREECKMRLLAENGDEIFSLTMTNPLSYVFDEVIQRASYIYRTKTVSEHLNLPRQEKKKTGFEVAMIQMSTFDNPIMTPETIKNQFGDITDPQILELRLYGVPTQVTGRIHKTYDPSICFIPYDKYFPTGIPYSWLHTRGIDYHESRIPWSVGWMSCSPDNEWFLWQEFHPAIDGKNAYNTYEIARHIVRNSGDYYYNVNLIDPLANKKQPNTLFSAVDDLNRYFSLMRENEGLGTPAYWQGWDTKGTTGRNDISMRFKNAVRCGKPFNNKIRKNAKTEALPTLWICDSAPRFHQSIMNWRYGEYVTTATKMVNDPKNEPQQKNSHDCMCLEGLAKDDRVKHSYFFMQNTPPDMVHRPKSITGR